MTSDRGLASSRCAEIRPMLRQFAAGELGRMRRGEVQAHLMECQECGEVLGAQLIDNAERGALPLLQPREIPASTLFDQYLGGRRTGIPWRTVLAGLVDPRTRDWATAQIQAIRTGLEVFTESATAFGVAARTRGAVSPDAIGSEPESIEADIGFSPGPPSRVNFRILAPAMISADNRFSLMVATDVTQYDGRTVICTIRLPNVEPIAFEATLEPSDRRGDRIVTFEGENLPAAGRRIPTSHITLAIV